MVERFIATDHGFAKSEGCCQRMSANAARYRPPIPLHFRLIPGRRHSGIHQQTMEDFMCAQRRRTRKGRSQWPAPRTLPDNLYDYADDPTPGLGRPRDHNARTGDEPLRVVDDWPEDVPVTEAEIRVFERWFGDVFDELLSPKKPKDDLPIISHRDMKRE